MWLKKYLNPRYLETARGAFAREVMNLEMVATQDKYKDRYVVSLGAEAERKLLRFANLEVSEGYPNERVMLVHDPPTYSSLRSPAHKLTRHMPLVFGHPNVTSRSHGNSHEAVPRDDFERQFHAFTSGIFADWEPSLWSNVLVAGAHRLPHLLLSAPLHIRHRCRPRPTPPHLAA